MWAKDSKKSETGAGVQAALLPRAQEDRSLLSAAAGEGKDLSAFISTNKYIYTHMYICKYIYSSST